MVDPQKIIEVDMKTTAYDQIKNVIAQHLVEGAYDQIQNVIAQHLGEGCIVLYTIWRFRKCIDDGT